MSGRGPKRKKPAPPAAVVWTDRAIRDLLAIEEYIAEEDPAAATRWTTELMARASKAAAVPYTGRMVPEVGRTDVREVLKGTYRIVYRVAEDGIAVLTVFEGHRLFPEDLGGDDADGDG